ncbi:hypothetical protein VTL71DRAFT_12416 [Oculimacula yallundae]|uniref:Uncharacterized protein n=1 Tax=Oculimacula yallundae TaxID=86028 RepID=A0ABR4CP50_9HELO
MSSVDHSSATEDPLVTSNSPVKDIVSPKPLRTAVMNSINRLATIIEENAVNPPPAVKVDTPTKPKTQARTKTGAIIIPEETKYISIRELMIGSVPDYGSGTRFGVVGGEKVARRVGVIGEERKRKGAHSMV